MRLRLDKQLVAKCVERFDVTAIEQLLRMPDLRRRLGAQARETMTSKFDARASFSAVETLLEETLGGGQ